MILPYFFRSPQIISPGENVYAVWIETQTSGGISSSNIIFWTKQGAPSQIDCSDVTLKPENWQINGNGFIGDLDIRSINSDGTVSGTLIMRNEPPHQITGFWDDISKKITFIRVININDPHSGLYMVSFL